jgi:1,2-diacylglycerol-3-alpha-glucose alpha-1,2-glucosyltransferase
LDVSINGKGYDYDIIHTHTSFFLNAFRMGKAKRLGVKTVSHAHTTADDMKGSFSFTQNKIALDIISAYLKNFYNQADIVLSPSEWTKSTLIKRGIKVPIEILSNGVDLKKFRYNKESAREFREKYDLTEDDVLIYGVGLVFLRKGIETFVKVARELSDMNFLWIGKKYNSFLISHSSINRIVRNAPKNMRFLGFVDSKDVVGAHCAGDVFLFPSYVENQGIVILEAAACSNAIVIRNLPVYDWAVNGCNCMVAKTNQEFVDDVKKLVENKNLRDKLGKNLYKEAKKHDIEKTVTRLIDIYDRVLNQ